MHATLQRAFINIRVSNGDYCIQAAGKHKIHLEKDGKWTMCYTDLADIADTCMRADEF